MTARHQTRVGRRLRGDRAPIEATSAPSVGEMLHAAREKKGVDLYRAERDTKIRARHLAALEDGDDADLPGAVYTKGFLRNYALYLGLDPVELIARWNDEQETPTKGARTVVVAPPQPLADPRRGFTFTPGMIVAVGLVAIIVLFVGYVGMQLFRFSQVPELRLDGGSVISVAAQQTSYALTGTSPAKATVRALDPSGTLVGSADANAEGRWSLPVPVQKGRNEFTLSARDPETGRDSPSQPVIITVAVPAKPTPVPTPAPTSNVSVSQTPTPGPSQPGITGDASIAPDTSMEPSQAIETGSATLAVTAPQDGGKVGDPTVNVRGTTNAKAVRVTARWAGTGKAPARPGDLRLDVSKGSFGGQLVLAPGRWAVDVTSVAGNGLGSTTVRRSVSVAYDGFAVQIGATPKGRAWIQIWVDGSAVGSGRIMSSGESQVVVAKRSVVVNTGVEKSTVLGIGGAAPDVLGPRNDLATWRIDKGKAPVKLR